MYSILTWINTLDFNSRWTRTRWSVYVYHHCSSWWYLDAVKMRCLIKLQWEQNLSIVARDKELRCMIGMYRYLLLGRSWEIFSLQLEETETNFRLKCRIIFQIRTQKLYYSFCSCQGSYFSHHDTWYQMLHCIIHVFYCITL